MSTYGKIVAEKQFVLQSQQAKLCTLLSNEAQGADKSSNTAVRLTTLLLSLSPSHVPFADRAYNFDYWLFGKIQWMCR